MQRHVFHILMLLTLAAVLAACGGGGHSGKLGSGDVAVVNGDSITTQQYNDLLDQAKVSFKRQGRAFPKPGTTEYAAVKTQVIGLLVQQVERDQEAKRLGITVTDQQVANRLTAIKKQYFGGNQKKYLAELKKEQLTEDAVRKSVKEQLISTAIQTHVTGGVTVTQKDIDAYYKANATQYVKAKSRDVRYILVKKQPLANSLYAQLKSAPKATWCTLAKKYSQDPSSKGSCGTGHFTKGQTVSEFDKVLFTAPTNVVQKPIHSGAYGWFVIEATSGIHPQTVTPEKKVAAQIKTTLLSNKKSALLTAYSTKTSKKYCAGKITYKAGYAPSPDPCTTTTTTNATTTG